MAGRSLCESWVVRAEAVTPQRSISVMDVGVHVAARVVFLSSGRHRARSVELRASDWNQARGGGRSGASPSLGGARTASVATRAAGAARTIATPLGAVTAASTQTVIDEQSMAVGSSQASVRSVLDVSPEDMPGMSMAGASLVAIAAEFAPAARISAIEQPAPPPKSEIWREAKLRSGRNQRRDRSTVL